MKAFQSWLQPHHVLDALTMAKSKIPGFLPKRRASLVLRAAQSQQCPRFCAGDRNEELLLRVSTSSLQQCPVFQDGLWKADKVSAHLHGIRVSPLL